jgi:cold shock CspA family protein
VADFDPDRGFGTVVGDQGGEALFFHCTAIADGSRMIETGARVRYQVAPGQLGRWEARDLSPV